MGSTLEIGDDIVRLFHNQPCDLALLRLGAALLRHLTAPRSQQT